ncbi:MAG: hypothetical protein ACREB3_07545 [Burkholderiales bacterium]
MKVVLQRERVHGLWEESAALLAQGFAAFDPYPDLPLDVLREAYEELEEHGLLRVYTGRYNGVLSGYCVFILGRSLRRRYLTHAIQDVVQTTNRALTVRLIRFAELELATEGIDLVYHSAPQGGLLGPLLVRLGYEPTGEVYAKRVTL